MSKNHVIESTLSIPKTSKHPGNKALSHCQETLGLAKMQQDLFCSVDPTAARCYPKRAGLESWEYLKKRIGELKLDSVQEDIFRFQANTLRVCCSRPIMVVYPDAVRQKPSNSGSLKQRLSKNT